MAAWADCCLTDAAPVETGYRAEGWRDVRASLERPGDCYNLVTVHAAGAREPFEAEQVEHERIAAATAARTAEFGDGNVDRPLEHRADFVNLGIPILGRM